MLILIKITNSINSYTWLLLKVVDNQIKLLLHK